MGTQGQRKQNVQFGGGGGRCWGSREDFKHGQEASLWDKDTRFVIRGQPVGEEYEIRDG